MDLQPGSSAWFLPARLIYIPIAPESLLERPGLSSNILSQIKMRRSMVPFIMGETLVN